MTMGSPASARLWQAWLAAVVFVFPIPGTIALRNLLLLTGLIALLATWRGAVRPLLVPDLKPAAWGFAATTLWLLLHSITVAPALTSALDNVRGDWLQPALTAALAAFAAARIGSRGAIQATIAALLAHMVWMLGWQLWLWLAAGATGAWPAGLVPFGERDYQSSVGGFLFALVLAERVSALSASPAAALLSARFAWPVLVIALIADVAMRTRNGTLVSILLLLVATVWISRHRPRFVLLLMAITTLGAASVSLDPRWSGLTESLATGWNSPTTYWLGGDKRLQPSTPSGAPLEESAYMRAAWAHQAVVAIAEHPLGLGFGRDGFGRAVEMKYGFKGMVSSHSGWLDFALAAGLPGLALLLLTAGLAIRGGWRQFRQHEDAAGLMLCFLVGGYLLRCLLDGHLSGWRLGLFAFLCGTLIAAMKSPKRQP